MQEKLMERSHLPENSCENPAFTMPKVSMQKNYVPRPWKSKKAGSQEIIFLYREKLACKSALFPEFLEKMESGSPKILHRPRGEIFEGYSHLPKIQKELFYPTR